MEGRAANYCTVAGKGRFQRFQMGRSFFDAFPNDTQRKTLHACSGRRPKAAWEVSAPVSFYESRWSQQALITVLHTTEASGVIPRCRPPSMPPKAAKEAIAFQDSGHVDGWYYTVNAASGIANITGPKKRVPYKLTRDCPIDRAAQRAEIRQHIRHLAPAWGPRRRSCRG